MVYKKVEIISNKINIPEGLFSKKYSLPHGIKKSVLCYTPNRSFVLLEGASAELWQIIYDDRGLLDRAYEHLITARNLELQEAESVIQGLAVQLEPLFLDTPTDVMSEIMNFIHNNHIIYVLTIELTHRCNERCKHCYRPDLKKDKEINVKTFKKLIDEFESLGGFRLTLTGGELLLRDDIEDILKVLIGRNIVVDFITNLTLLDDRKLELISKIKPLQVGVTVHSADPKIHDSITGLEGSFYKTISSIKRLRRKGVPVLIKTVLFNRTINGYEKLKKLAEELNSNIDFTFAVLPKLEGNEDNTPLRINDKRRLLEVFSDLGVIAQKKELTPKKRKYACGAGQQGLAISPYGDVKACIVLLENLGKFPDQSLYEIWNGPKLKKVVSSLRIKNYKKCSKCKYLNVCNICVGSWKEKKVPDDYTCLLTKLRCRHQ